MTGTAKHGSRESGGRRSAARRPYSVDARRGSEPSPADLEIRRVVNLDPVAVARWWATSLATGYLDDAVAVYGDEAEVRCDDEVASGRRHIARLLESLPVASSGRRPDDTSATGSDVVVSWWPTEGSPGVKARMTVEGGVILDQEISASTGEPPVTEPTSFPVEVVRQGRIAPGAVEAAIEKVERAAHLSGTTVSSARLKLRQLPDPAVERRSVAEVSLDLDGEIVRASADAPQMADAIDRLGHRLEDRLRHRHERLGWVRPTHVEASEGEWRHGNLATPRGPWFDRPVDEREIVRHKTWEGGDVTVDEAVFDLELLDHTFHLFRDVATGADSYVERQGDEYVLTQIGGADEAAVAGAAATVRIDGQVPPSLSVTDAVDALDIGGDARLFFADVATGRGMVLYRRFDGHYGLVTPES